MTFRISTSRAARWSAFAILFFCAAMLSSPARAGAAADYGQASRSEQALLLQHWAVDPQPSRLPLLEALSHESVVSDAQGHLFNEQGGKLVPLEGEPHRRAIPKSVYEQPHPRSGSQCSGLTSTGERGR